MNAAKFFAFKAIYPVLGILLLLMNQSVSNAANLTEGKATDTGLRHWQWQNDHVLLRLTQRLPDQTRGYFLARGFSETNAERLAVNCTFQTTFKNIANNKGSAVDINMANWRIKVNGVEKKLIVKEQWQQQWQKANVSDAALIAFTWSMMPTTQTYHPGDYNWGMTTFGLKPGLEFDLSFNWYVNGKPEYGKINNIACPADIHPETGNNL